MALAGCNQIFGLTDPAVLVDAPQQQPLPDAPSGPMFGDCIVEPFDSFDPATWTRMTATPPLDVSFTNGELVIDGSSPTPTTDGIVTTQTYDFRGGAVEVQLTDTIDASNRDIALTLHLLDEGSVEVKRRLGELAYSTNLRNTSLLSMDFAPADGDTFWRIRHDEAGTFSIETSPDGIVWNGKLTTPDAGAVIAASVSLNAFADAGVVDRGAFDNLKLRALCPP